MQLSQASLMGRRSMFADPSDADVPATSGMIACSLLKQAQAPQVGQARRQTAARLRDPGA